MAKSKKNVSKKEKPVDSKTQEQQWLEELQNSEVVQNYLSGFTPSSVESFLKYYLSKKSLWHTYSDYYKGYTDDEQLRWINRAFRHLELILQKKLFDAQCLWRAEKVTYPGIEICEDFKVWQHNVFNCPFIEPVNEYDVDLYARYLQQNNAEVELDSFGEWFDYRELKEAHSTNNQNMNFPEWYDFHNGYTGGNVLMLLPDIRGEKEIFYTKLYAAHMRELNKERDKEFEKNRDDRPWIQAYDPETIKWFVSTFESKEEQVLYKEYTFANRHRNEKETLTYIIDDLLKADEYVPIESHHDCFEALKRALNTYKCKKIAEALPMALEQYQMNVQMGIGFSTENKYSDNSIRAMWLESILHGRRLNGDPEDLNF